MANAGEFPKVDGDIIYRDDYNLIRQAVEDVLSGWWLSTFTATAIVGNPVITAAQLQLLINDINKAYTHITGSNSSLAIPGQGAVIENELWSSLATAAQYIETNKLEIGPGQYADVTTTYTRVGPWNGQVVIYRDVSFASTAEASQFFKTGGRVLLTASSANSDGSSKSSDWAVQIVGAFPQQVYGYNQWIAGTTLSHTEYGNDAKYAENYIALTITKINSTTLRYQWDINDADTGDQTGLGAAVDENVGLDVSMNITTRTSTGAITATAPTVGAIVDITPP